MLAVYCESSSLNMERPVGAAVYAKYVLDRLKDSGEVEVIGSGAASRADALLNLDGRFRPGRGQPVVTAVLDLGHLFARQAYTPRAWLAQNWKVASAARRSDHLLVPSPAVRGGLERYLRVPPERVTVLPPLPGPHFRRATRLQVEEARRRFGLPPRYFLFVGVRSRRKNLELLAAARARAEGDLEGVGLVLVGPGRPSLAGALDLGYVDSDELPALLSGAVAWLNPSHYEGSSIGALEAMACGTPVAVAATGAQAHEVGLTGMVLPPGDVLEWGRALVALVGDADLRGRMAGAGIRKLAQLRASAPEIRPLLSVLAGAAPGGA